MTFRVDIIRPQRRRGGTETPRGMEMIVMMLFRRSLLGFSDGW